MHSRSTGYDSSRPSSGCLKAPPLRAVSPLPFSGLHPPSKGPVEGRPDEEGACVVVRAKGPLVENHRPRGDVPRVRIDHHLGSVPVGAPEYDRPKRCPPILVARAPALRVPRIPVAIVVTSLVHLEKGELAPLRSVSQVVRVGSHDRETESHLDDCRENLPALGAGVPAPIERWIERPSVHVERLLRPRRDGLRGLRTIRVHVSR